jgi:hypothetical protein
MNRRRLGCSGVAAVMLLDITLKAWLYYDLDGAVRLQGRIASTLPT